MARLSLTEFIRQNRADIDAAIKRVCPNCRLNDAERRQWILNDEGLYQWARSEGVRVSNPPLRGVQQLGPNMTEVEHGDVTVLYSYKTPVAAFLPGTGFMRTDQSFSRTTSRHISKWLEHHGGPDTRAIKVPQDVIARLAEHGEYVRNPRAARAFIEREIRGVPARRNPGLTTGYGDVDTGLVPAVPGRTPHYQNPRQVVQAGLGSVSTTTLKTSDLLDAFTDALEGVYAGHRMPAETRKLCKEARAMLKKHDGPDLDYDNTVSEQAGYVVDELMTALEEVAPPYAYFGAHPDDGADFGWWPSLDALEDDARSGEVLKVDDMGDVPDDYSGYVMHVSDHGNVTLYSCKRGECEEVWGVV